MSKKDEIELKKSEQYDEKFFDEIANDLVYMAQNNQMLKDNKDLFMNDPSLILYRLPLTEQQREKLFNDIIKNNYIDE